MPSGKQSRARRRVPAPPTQGQKRGQRGRQASPKVLIGAGVFVCLVAVGVVLAVVLGGGSSTPAASVPAVGSLEYGLPGASYVQSLFQGIPQHGQILGNPSAPVTLEEFIDPQCPYCQMFETQVFPSLVSSYVRQGKVKVQMEPWAFIGPDSVTGQAAELAASEQNRIFNYAALLYINQKEENSGWLNQSMVAAVAESIPGLKVHALISAQSSSAVKSAQQKVDNLATQLQITGTPTIFVGKSGKQGAKVAMTSATDKAAVVAAIVAAGG